jgi:hypothetical protein
MAKKSIERPYELVLDLDSRAGNPIANVQNSEPIEVAYAANLENSHRAKFDKIVERTVGCTDRYNCHGLVFAARRTKIYEAASIRQIICEDGYKKLDPDKALAGDVVLYIHKSGDISHSGIVVGPSSLFTNNYLVVSKWGPWAEIIHHVFDCPYSREPDVAIEFYRARYD